MVSPFLYNFFILMHMGVLLACVSVCHMVPGADSVQKRALDPLELELESGCLSPRGRWEYNLDPLEEQPELCKH